MAIHAIRSDGTSTQDIKKQRRDRANDLLNRWGWLVRDGLPDLGYPHQSPEQERIRGIDTRNVEADQVDEQVFKTVNELKTTARHVAFDYWARRHTYEQIARQERLSVSGVKWRLDAIREKVARDCNF